MFDGIPDPGLNEELFEVGTLIDMAIMRQFPPHKSFNPHNLSCLFSFESRSHLEWEKEIELAELLSDMPHNLDYFHLMMHAQAIALYCTALTKTSR